jgi:hypothetical protein
MIMDPYVIEQLMTARHDDLVREADETRRVRQARDTRDEARPAPEPRKARARRLGIA